MCRAVVRYEPMALGFHSERYLSDLQGSYGKLD